MQKQSKTQPSKNDFYQQITNQIIAQLAKNILPWRKPWGILPDGKAEVARNYFTAQPYQGINSILLACQPFERPYFLTFKQAVQLGGKIRKGAIGVPIVYWNVINKENQVVKKNGDSETKTIGIPLIKPYYVFNIADVEGIDFQLPELKKEPTQAEAIQLSRWQAIYSQSPNPPAIVFTDPKRAYYSKTLDIINMPHMNAFVNNQAYFLTLYHELIHASGHVDRLNRADLNTAGRGSESYAKEELTAEIGACFLAANSGMTSFDDYFENSVSYIQKWLNALQNDKTLIVRAASQAQKACQYILGQANDSAHQQAA